MKPIRMTLLAATAALFLFSAPAQDAAEAAPKPPAPPKPKTVSDKTSANLARLKSVSLQATNVVLNSDAYRDMANKNQVYNEAVRAAATEAGVTDPNCQLQDDFKSFICPPEPKKK